MMVVVVVVEELEDHPVELLVEHQGHQGQQVGVVLKLALVPQVVMRDHHDQEVALEVVLEEDVKEEVMVVMITAQCGKKTKTAVVVFSGLIKRLEK
jgi:hypothetical protein